MDYGGGLFIQTTDSGSIISDSSESNERFLSQKNSSFTSNFLPQKRYQQFRQLEQDFELFYTQNNQHLPTNNSQKYYQDFIFDDLWVETDDQQEYKNKYEKLFQLIFSYNVIIDGCQFFYNYVFSEGGAIFVKIIDNSKDLLRNQVAVLNSQISHNIAEINSPGIGSLTFIPALYNNSQFNNTSRNRVITAFNIAPSNLNIYFQNGSVVKSLYNISSKQLFDQGNLIVEFSNMNSEKIYLNDPSIVTSAKKPQIFLSYDQIKVAIDTFSEEDGTITIQPQQFIYTPGSVADFIFTSPNILTPTTVDDFIVIQMSSTSYQKIIKAFFKQCQIGEIYFQDKKICSSCSFGTYSLEDPISARCTDCPQGAFCPGGSQILLLEGYWSDKTIKKDEIIYCSRNPTNCVGEISSNSINNREFQPKRYLIKDQEEHNNPFFPCLEGHIGALCEVCDLKGLKNGMKYYQIEGYQCEQCQQIAKIYIKLGFYIIISVAVALITVYTLVSEIQNKIIKNVLKIVGILMVGINSQYYQIASSLFKILINYGQINLIIYTLDLKIPNELSNIFISIISPFKFLETGFDCLLSNIFSLQVVFVKSIGFCLLPILYYVMLLFILTIVEMLKRKFIKSYYFYTACFFITLFSIPNVIQYLALVLSCRRVGSQKYIAADMSQICYSNQHLRYIKSIIVPGIAVYGLLIPLLFVCILYFNKDKFDQKMFEMKYGFLYREYKSTVFYWEIVRLGCKEIIFISVSIWDEQQELKALIVSLLLIFYYGILQRVQPFKNQLLNRYEQISTSLNLLSIILALIVKQINNYTTSLLLYIFIIGQNALFISFIIYRIICINKAKILSCLSLTKIKILVCLKISNKQYLQEMKEKQINETILKSHKISKNWQILRIYIFVLQFYKKLNKNLGMHSSQVIFSFIQAKQSSEILNSNVSLSVQRKNLLKLLNNIVDSLKNNEQQSFIVEGKVISPVIQSSQDTDNQNLKNLEQEFIQNMKNFQQAHLNTFTVKDDYYKNDNFYAARNQRNERSPTFLFQIQHQSLNSSETPFQHKKQITNIDEQQWISQTKQNIFSRSIDIDYNNNHNNINNLSKSKQNDKNQPQKFEQIQIELQDFSKEIKKNNNIEEFLQNTFKSISKKVKLSNFHRSEQFSYPSQVSQDFELNDSKKLLSIQNSNKIDSFSPQIQNYFFQSGIKSEEKEQKNVNFNSLFSTNNKQLEIIEEQQIHTEQIEIQLPNQNNFNVDQQQKNLQEITIISNQFQSNIDQKPYNEHIEQGDDQVIKFDTDESDYDLQSELYYQKQISTNNQSHLQQKQIKQNSSQEDGNLVQNNLTLFYLLKKYQLKKEKQQNNNQDEGNSGDAFIN